MKNLTMEHHNFPEIAIKKKKKEEGKGELSSKV